MDLLSRVSSSKNCANTQSQWASQYRNQFTKERLAKGNLGKHPTTTEIQRMYDKKRSVGNDKMTE